MANTFYTPTQVAATAISLANEDAFLSALVNRNYENDLLGGGGKGRTVNIRVPAVAIAHSRSVDETTAAITLDSLTESTVPVTLGTHLYNAIPLSEADLSLDLQDFSRQVLAPQVDAVVYAVEDFVATALKGVTLTLMGAGNPLPTYSAADPVAMLTAIRKLLRDRGVPTSGLNLVVGTQVYADLLSTAKIMDVSQSASTAALREGNVGSVRGFTVVESTRVDDGEIIAFHRDAFTLAVRAPIVPAGASFGQSLSERGFSLRYLRDYDAVHTVDRSIVSTFAGVAALPFKSVNRSTGALTDVVPAIHVQAIA